MEGKDPNRLANEKRKWRRAGSHVALVFVVAIACLLGIRIWQVNIRAWMLPVEHYSAGEQVDLEGAFAENSYEQTDGYSLKVTKAEIMTPQEFVQAYGVDPDAQLDNVDEPDSPYLVVLTLDIENVGNEEGHLSSLSWCLISPDEPCVAYYADFNIWAYAHPVMESQPCFELKSDSTFTVHIPFSRQQPAKILQPLEEAGYAQVTQESFSFIFTNAPVRKQIDFTLG